MTLGPILQDQIGVLERSGSFEGLVILRFLDWASTTPQVFFVSSHSFQSMRQQQWRISILGRTI